MDDTESVEWAAGNEDRHITWYADRSITRQLRDDELPLDKAGQPVRRLWDTERMRNDYAAMRYFQNNSKVPVPKCRLYAEDGLLHLEVSHDPNHIRLRDVKKELEVMVKACVEEQLLRAVIPALQECRRNHIGSVNEALPVFPPERVYQRDDRTWDRITCDEDMYFSFCHNDLSPNNIWLDRNNYKIVSITGWQYAGYFPAEFELPLWRKHRWDGRRKMGNKALARDLELFGLKPPDLKNCFPELEW